MKRTAYGPFWKAGSTMSSYVPRLTAPSQTDPLYNSNLNPYYATGWGMPNCTTYAWGRAWELVGGQAGEYPNGVPLDGYHDAENWYNHPDGWPRGSTPQLGAIACYRDGAFSGRGHVCVLERDNGDGTWLVSESALNSYYFRASHSISANGAYGYGDYIFQGFIYVPWVGGSKGFKWWMARKLIYNKRGLII